MRRRLTLLFFGFFSLSFSAEALAGAWVQEKGKGLNIFTFSHYSSGQYWTPGGSITGTPLYTKYQLSEYLEYGLTERFTLGGYFSGLQSHTGQDGIGRGSLDNVLLGRYLLWSGGPSVFSFQLFVDWLGHGVEINIPANNSHLNTGEALLAGTSGNLDALGQNHWFADISLGLVQRYSAGSQAQIILEGGLKYYQDRLWLFLQNIDTISLNHLAHPQGPNYSLATLVPSIVYWPWSCLGTQVGLAQDLYGLNVGKGTSPFISLWYRF